MAFVDVGRFLDRSEAYIACGALQAAGFTALVRDNHYANTVFGTTIATGGYGVLVPETDLAGAREHLETALEGNAEARDWRQHPQFLSGLPLAATAAIVGPLIAAARARPSLFNISVAIGIVAMIVAMFTFSIFGGFD